VTWEREGGETANACCWMACVSCRHCVAACLGSLGALRESRGLDPEFLTYIAPTLAARLELHGSSITMNNGSRISFDSQHAAGIPKVSIQN
jgi:hypothetical protein